MWKTKRVLGTVGLGLFVIVFCVLNADNLNKTHQNNIFNTIPEVVQIATASPEVNNTIPVPEKIERKLDTASKHLTDVLFRLTNKSRQYLKSSVKQSNITTRQYPYGENLMTVGPFKTLKEYKSPCWKAKNGKLQCLPYFFQIGAPKSGTTDLFGRIMQHPQMARVRYKEPHWLTRRRFYCIRGVTDKWYNATQLNNKTACWTKYCEKPKNVERKPDCSRLDYYINHYYSRSIKDIEIQRDQSGKHDKIFGDASCSLFWDHDYWRNITGNENMDEPKYTTADIVHHLNPNVKLISIIRDPVERLFSDYMYFFKNDTKSPQDFHDNVMATINFTNMCLQSETLRKCSFQPHPKKMVRIRIGFYHLHFKEWFRVFPREQFLILKMENYSSNIENNMVDIFNFLDLKAVDSRTMATISSTAAKHSNSNNRSRLKQYQMFDRTRLILEDYYRPHNEELEKLLGEDFNYNKLRR